MFVYKVWWLNRDKQLWEGQGEHEKEKKTAFGQVSQLFLSETVAATRVLNLDKTLLFVYSTLIDLNEEQRSACML